MLIQADPRVSVQNHPAYTRTGLIYYGNNIVPAAESPSPKSRVEIQLHLLQAFIQAALADNRNDHTYPAVS